MDNSVAAAAAAPSSGNSLSSSSSSSSSAASVLKPEEISVGQVALYAAMSFLIVSLLGVLIYITCSKKYRLNWFEKHLLEAATETEEMTQSQEVLLNRSNVAHLESMASSSRSLHRNSGSPISNVTTNMDDPSFWVPHALGTQVNPPVEVQPANLMITTSYDTSGDALAGGCSDDSLPPTPTSPTESNRSINSINSTTGNNNVPLARSDKHILLAMSPARPKVSSMQTKLDYTKIDTSLYTDPSKSRSTSMSEDSKGIIHLQLLYDPIAGILSVKLIDAQDLQPRDFSGTADPYAKIRLLPDKTNVWQTRIHKRTLNPIFDEDFVFEERPAVIGRRTLEVLLYDFDAYSRHVCIGATQIALAHVDLSDKVELWKHLTTRGEQDAKIELGELMVSLSYLPSAERLTVVVIKARNLRVVDDSRNSTDPYVKVSLWHSGKKLKKRKTGVQRCNVCPVFNEALIFDVNKDTLKSCIIEFLVVHDSLLGSNESLGRAIVGNLPNVRVEERNFFEEMFRTKSATAQWIPLSDPRQRTVQ